MMWLFCNHWECCNECLQTFDWMSSRDVHSNNVGVHAHSTRFTRRFGGGASAWQSLRTHTVYDIQRPGIKSKTWIDSDRIIYPEPEKCPKLSTDVCLLIFLSLAEIFLTLQSKVDMAPSSFQGIYHKTNRCSPFWENKTWFHVLPDGNLFLGFFSEPHLAIVEIHVNTWCYMYLVLGVTG